MTEKNNLCDGSCLVSQMEEEIIPCEDGEILRFYWCKHEGIYVLTYAPRRLLLSSN